MSFFNLPVIFKWQLVSVLVFLLMNTGLAYGLGLDDLFKNTNQRAVEMLERGEAEAAAAQFTDPQWRGVSRYEAGLYQDAMEDFKLSEDANGLYNFGTAAARAGDYTQAVESLERALSLAPDDPNIAHNLEIAKKLQELAQQQQQEQDGQGQDNDSQDNDNQDSQNQNDQGQSGQDQSDEDGEQDSEGNSESDQQSDGQQGDEKQQSQSSSDNQADNPGGNQSQNDSQKNSGELDADEQDQSSDSESAAQGAQDLRDMMQQEQAGQQSESPPPPSNQQQQQQDQQMQAASSEPGSVSEDDQATEQWLRRIPDDASQLLRNKIRLNHLIEYPEVRDMQEPW